MCVCVFGLCVCVCVCVCLCADGVHVIVIEKKREESVDSTGRNLRGLPHLNSYSNGTLQTAVTLHCRLVVAVGLTLSYCRLVQLTSAEHTRSLVLVAGTASYWPDEHGGVYGRQTRSDTAVHGVCWYVALGHGEQRPLSRGAAEPRVPVTFVMVENDPDALR